MNSKEIVLDLLKKKRPDLSMAGLERELGIANGTIGKWNTATPSTKTAQKVADYFNVPLMYIFGEDDKKQEKASDNNDPIDLDKLLAEEGTAMFDGQPLSEEYKKALLAMLKTMKGK